LGKVEQEVIESEELEEVDLNNQNGSGEVVISFRGETILGTFND